MTGPAERNLGLLALLCCAVLVGGIIWASDRGLDLTDEAYYLLSAVHPDQVQLYISAQHWVLAPLWDVTGSLVWFRLAGAALLLGAGALLGWGAVHALTRVTGTQVTAATALGVAAAGAVGAALYVATIAPSPSYNLMASAGAYVAVGAALLGLDRRRAWVGAAMCLGAGVGLAVCMVNKPSAGVCVGVTVLVLVLSLQSGRRGVLMVGAGGVGALAMLAGLYLLQPADPPVAQALRGGLDLFRMVQTEPVTTRLARYGVTLLGSTGQAMLAFWPAVGLLVVLLRYPQHGRARGLAWGLVLAAFGGIVWGQHHLGGMTRYVAMAEGVYALVILTLALAARQWVGPGRVAVLWAGLLILPFSITIGTGNALFTQVIVALAPWTVLAMLTCLTASRTPALRLGQVGLVMVMLVLIAVQVLTSYTRDPYHLRAPLTAQTQAVTVGRLGGLRVDPVTAGFLDDMAKVRAVCAATPDTAFLGMYNVPGLALVLGAVPPVTPWLNNRAQAETVLTHWQPATPVILAVTPEGQADPTTLPVVLRPDPQRDLYCGAAILPHDGAKVVFWRRAVR